MKTLSLSEAKMKLSGLIQSVDKTDEVIVITKNGRPAAMLINPDEYESWQETLRLRSDPEMMKEIEAGLKALKKKKAKLYTLDELFS